MVVVPEFEKGGILQTMKNDKFVGMSYKFWKIQFKVMGNAKKHFGIE